MLSSPQNQPVDVHAVEMQIENFLDNFKKNYADWETSGHQGLDSKSIEQQTTSSDSGTSLCSVTSLSSIAEVDSSSSNLPNSESASSSLSMKSNVSSATSSGSGHAATTGSESSSRTGTPKNLGKFRQFYKSAFLALSQTSDFDRGKYRFSIQSY